MNVRFEIRIAVAVKRAVFAVQFSRYIQKVPAKCCKTTPQCSSAYVYEQYLQNPATRFHSIVLQMCTNCYCKTLQHNFAVQFCRCVQTATARHCNTTSQYSSADAYKLLLQNTATQLRSIVLQMCTNCYCKTLQHNFAVQFCRCVQIGTAKHCNITSQYSCSRVPAANATPCNASFKQRVECVTSRNRLIFINHINIPSDVTGKVQKGV